MTLRYPGEYIVSENMATGGGTGHSWQLQLLTADRTAVSTYTTEGTWNEGNITYDAPWVLTDVPAGNYTLRVQNVMEWGQPKLQSLTLEYDGIIPVEPEDIRNVGEDNLSGQAYDLLGRPVDASYNGIVIRGGKKYIQSGR